MSNSFWLYPKLLYLCTSQKLKFFVRDIYYTFVFHISCFCTSNYFFFIVAVCSRILRKSTGNHPRERLFSGFRPRPCLVVAQIFSHPSIRVLQAKQGAGSQNFRSLRRTDGWIFEFSMHGRPVSPSSHWQDAEHAFSRIQHLHNLGPSIYVPRGQKLVLRSIADIF